MIEYYLDIVVVYLFFWNIHSSIASICLSKFEVFAKAFDLLSSYNINHKSDLNDA